MSERKPEADGCLGVSLLLITGAIAIAVLAVLASAGAHHLLHAWFGP